MRVITLGDIASVFFSLTNSTAGPEDLGDETCWGNWAFTGIDSFNSWILSAIGMFLTADEIHSSALDGKVLFKGSRGFLTIPSALAFFNSLKDIDKLGLTFLSGQRILWETPGLIFPATLFLFLVLQLLNWLHL